MLDIHSSGDRHMANAIAARAAMDFAFRRRLLTDPRSAVSEVLGYPLPAGFRIKFIEKDPHIDALVVLPDALPASHGLSEEGLDACIHCCWDTSADGTAGTAAASSCESTPS